MLLHDLGSQVLVSTPSYAVVIAQAVLDAGIDPATLKLELGLFGGEPWTEGLRAQIESALPGLRAVNFYGLSEMCGPGVAAECIEARDGLHVHEDHFIVEVVDPDSGAVLGEGEEGELVFTTLAKEAMPFLRYRTADIGSLTLEPCRCGRTTARIRGLRGRRDDMIVVRGVNVYPSNVEHALLSVPEVAPHYQLVVERSGAMDELTVQCEPSGANVDPARLRNAVEHVLREHLGIRVRAEVLERGACPKAKARPSASSTGASSICSISATRQSGTTSVRTPLTGIAFRDHRAVAPESVAASLTADESSCACLANWLPREWRDMKSSVDGPIDLAALPVMVDGPGVEIRGTEAGELTVALGPPPQRARCPSLVQGTTGRSLPVPSLGAHYQRDPPRLDCERLRRVSSRSGLLLASGARTRSARRCRVPRDLADRGRQSAARTRQRPEGVRARTSCVARDGGSGSDQVADVCNTRLSVASFTLLLAFVETHQQRRRIHHGHRHPHQAPRCFPGAVRCWARSHQSRADPAEGAVVPRVRPDRRGVGRDRLLGVTRRLRSFPVEDCRRDGSRGSRADRAARCQGVPGPRNHPGVASRDGGERLES